MDKKLEKVKAFVKEHKVEIARAVGAAVCGVVVFAVTKRKPNIQKTDVLFIPKNIEVPEELVKYGVEAIDVYDGAVDLHTAYAEPGYKVAVAELGKLGEALCKIPDIKSENLAFLHINIAKEINNN